VSILLACALIVHDGDTVRCQKERIRIENIDAPELRGSPSCRREKRKTHWCDYKLGIRSRDALKAFVAGKQVRIDRTGRDRYGRSLARLSVNGQDAGAYLISRGLARPWR
jgi:micrococcal nuclease